MNKKILVLFLSLFYLLSLSLFAEDMNELSANELYSEGNYSKAIEKYEQIHKINPYNGKVNFNLGNIYFRNEELGKAIFYYKKASQLIPRDTDLSFNLQYARSKVIDKIESRKTAAYRISLVRYLNQKESLYLVASLSLLFWFIVLIGHYKRGETTKILKLITMVLFCIFLTIWIKDFMMSSKFGVMVKQCQIYSGAGINNTALFSLNEGSEFEIRESINNNWLKIKLSDGKRGFVENRCVIK